MAGSSRTFDQRPTGGWIGGRAATFAQAQPIPEESIGKVLRRRRPQVTKGTRLVERQIPAEKMAPAHHTLGQGIVRCCGAVQETERKGEGFGIGIVREQHTTGVGQEASIGLLGRGSKVDHKGYGSF